jgi:N-acetylmuramoyl-L-alanine amidase
MRHEKFSSVGRDLTQEIKDGHTYKTERKINQIIIHCSASPQGRGDDAHTIDGWHQERWGSGIGYHYVVLEDGTIQKGRWVDYAGAHAVGYNTYSIGICRIGQTEDDLTPKQNDALVVLTKLLLSLYSLSYDDVRGHKELKGVHKTCPEMDMEIFRHGLQV